MANTELFFNWRGSGASHRPPIANEWVMDLLRNTLELDVTMLQDMGGAIRSEIYGAALIMMQALELVEMPDWMPVQYRNSRHNFESGMDRLRFMAPALVAALGSDPENTIRTRCEANGIPASLRKEATPPGGPNSVSHTAEKLPARREQDLRTQLKKKSDGTSTSAIQAGQSNLDVQEATEDNNNTVPMSTLLPAPAPRYANTDRRFSAGLRGTQRDKLIVTVRNYGGKELKKEWKARAGTPELRLHLVQQGWSEDLIRRAITVSLRSMGQRDYDGITSVIKQIPLVHFATSTGERGTPDVQVNPPVVTIQSTPPPSSSSARNTLDSSRTSSSQGTSRSHPLVDLTQPEGRSRQLSRTQQEPARSSRRRSVSPRGRAATRPRRPSSPRRSSPRSSRSRRSPRSSRRSLTRTPERGSSRQDRDRVPRSRDNRDPSRGRDTRDSSSKQARR